MRLNAPDMNSETRGSTWNGISAPRHRVTGEWPVSAWHSLMVCSGPVESRNATHVKCANAMRILSGYYYLWESARCEHSIARALNRLNALCVASAQTLQHCSSTLNTEPVHTGEQVAHLFHSNLFQLVHDCSLLFQEVTRRRSPALCYQSKFDAFMHSVTHIGWHSY